jgi:hypothetical protein
MNPFEDLMNDTVFLVKPDGKRLGPYKTAMMGDACAIDDKTLDININDVIVRPLPNGKEELYTVTRADFREDFGPILGGFDITLMKQQQIKESKNQQPSFNIGTLNAQNVQVGNENSQTINITVQQLVEQIAKSNDAEAKNLLKQFLENSTVANIIGAVASTLLSSL